MVRVGILQINRSPCRNTDFATGESANHKKVQFLEKAVNKGTARAAITATKSINPCCFLMCPDDTCEGKTVVFRS